MRKKKRIILATMCIVLAGITGSLTGCSSSVMGMGASETAAAEMPPQSVSLVLSGHRYFPAVSLNTEEIYSEIYNACFTYGDLSAVVVDGEPFVAADYHISPPKANVDSAKKKQIAADNTEQIIAELSDIAGETPEVDTLAAIQLSAKALQSTDKGNEKTMLIYDSGLSTTSSLLNFASQNLIEEPAENIVHQLDEIHAIPDLKDTKIIWFGLGETCGDQQKLNSSFVYNLKNIWESILTAGGAASVTFDSSPVFSEETEKTLPECSTVPVVEDSLVLTENSELPDIIKWDEKSDVRFKGDLAEFTDTETAREALRPVAEYLSANPEETIYIFGMTATITGGGSGIELANARAAACEEVLKEAGASEDQMISVGLGQIANPLRINDVDEQGNQIEELAQKNRAVVIVKAENPLVEKLLKCVSDYE